MPPLHQIIFMTMWLSACIYAGLRGGAPERLVAAAQLIAGILTILNPFIVVPPQGPYSSVEVIVAVTDTILFVAVVLIALLSTRFWPMLMASMLGCGMFGHLAKPLGPDILPQAYYVSVAFWGYPVVILLALGTRRHRIRLKRYGVDYAWVWNLPRRYRGGWSINELAPTSPRR